MKWTTKRASELPGPDTMLRMPYDGRDVPHAVIEVNQKCNISCRACYKDKLGYTKPVERVKEEIDIAARERNLRILTLAGGEPSLHPQLPEIISYITSKGISAQMLSNGYSLDDERLASYKAAGLSTVYLHIDSLQRRPDAVRPTTEAGLHPLRREIAARVDRHGIHCALSLTLYKENLPQLPDVVDFVLTTPHVHRLLVTLCTDFGGIGEAVNPDKEASGTGVSREDLAGQEVSNAEVKRLLAERCGLLPFGYVASSQDLREERWLLYYAFTVYLPGAGMVALPAGPDFRRVVGPLCKVSKRLTGSMPFGQVMGELATAVMAVGNGLSARDPRTLGLLAARLWPGSQLTQKSLVFQQGPNLRSDGKLEFCKDCPDATVRDGKLVPVCMADVLDRRNAAGLLCGAAPTPVGVCV